jgi:DNA-binding MarR family transcriptional regulator
MSWLFRTCIRLQTSLDHRFLRFGMTVQEASVLLRCVEAREVTPGHLSVALGRDKGKISRFVDRLETRRLLTRHIDRRDRRVSLLRPTAKGKRVARDLASVFGTIRKELFVGVREIDVLRLNRMLPQLYKNAIRIGSRPKRSVGRERRRIGRNRINSQMSAIERQGVLTGRAEPVEDKDPSKTLAMDRTDRGKVLVLNEQNQSEHLATAGRVALT